MKKRIFSLALASTMVLGTFGTVMAADEVLENKPFVDGYPGGTFKPDNSVTRAEVAKLVSVAYDLATQDSKFSDAQDHWANKYIGALASVVKGYPDGTYKPDNTMTRAEFATVMSRVNDSDIKPSDKSFSDIGNHWAEDDIKRMASAGVVNGYEDGSFRPDQPVTRAEAVTMILRNEGIKVDEDIEHKVENPFTDVLSDAWYVEEVLSAAVSYNYVLDANGVRKVVPYEAKEEIKAFDVVDKVITDQSTDLLVNIKDENGNVLDYASIYADGYAVKFTVEGSRDRILDPVTVFGTAEAKPVKLIPSKMKEDKVYTIKAVLSRNGVYVSEATGTVQRVKYIDESKVSSIDKVKLVRNVSCSDFDETRNFEVELTSNTLVGGNEGEVAGEVASIKDIIATVNGGEYNLVDNIEDVKVTSSNPSVVRVSRDKLRLTAYLAGKADITISYGTKKIVVPVTVVKEERELTSAEFLPASVDLVDGSTRSIRIKTTDQYGDAVSIAKADGSGFIYQLNVAGETVTLIDPYRSVHEDLFAESVSFDTCSTLTPGKLGTYDIGIKGLKPGTGKIYLQKIDAKAKTTINVAELPVNVTSVRTLGEKKIVINNESESKDWTLDLAKSSDDEVTFHIEQLTKAGSFLENVTGVRVSVDNPDLFDKDPIEQDADGNITLKANKVGTAVVTLSKNGEVIGRVEVEIINSEAKSTITRVVHNDDVKLDEVKEYLVEDFLQPKGIKTNVASLLDAKIEKNGDITVDGTKVGKLKIEVTYLYDDGTVVGSAHTINTFVEDPTNELAGYTTPVVELRDVDGARKAKVSIEVEGEDASYPIDGEYDKFYNLSLID